MKTICEIFEASTRQYPDHVFVHHLQRDWTYHETWERSNALAAWLRGQGLKKGDRVGLVAANSAEYVISYFGILMAGGIVVALNPDTTSRELQNTLAHCQPAAVVTNPAGLRHMEQIADELSTIQAVICLSEATPETDRVGAVQATFDEVTSGHSATVEMNNISASDVAQIIYTSGTTGRPKGVTLSHQNLTANCASIVEYLNLTSDDSVMVILPFYYSYGNSLLLTHAAVGGRLVLASDFVYWNRVLQLMISQHVTGFSGVPSTYAMLLHKSKFQQMTFPDLRYLTCAGGALAPATIKRISECLPDARIFPMYGQTEGAARLSTLMPEAVHTRVGSIGKGIPGVELSVVDENGNSVAVGELGEIRARGENIMQGYWNDPEATQKTIVDGTLRTGDIARVDEDGYIYIVGRRSDMIKSGAYRINPQEIEEVILEMDEVVETAVVGQEDQVLGEIVVAFVVAAPKATDAIDSLVLEHCKRSLPRHKTVRHVYLVDTLPKTSSGKIQRAELRSWIANGNSARVPAVEPDPSTAQRGLTS